MQNLQLYSHYCFSKILRTLFDFLNNTYWVSLFVRNNQLIFWTGVSCFSVTLFYSTLFCCGRKANLVRFTLFYSTLLTLTDRMTDGGTNTLASRGLEEPAHALRGLEKSAHASRGLEELFLQLCCYVSFWFWREIGFGFTYYLCTQGIVPYSCGVVLVFLVLAGNIQLEKYKFQSSVWQVRDRYYDRKKSSSRLSGGCAIVITTGKKSSSCDFYAKLNVSNLNVTNLYQFQL